MNPTGTPLGRLARIQAGLCWCRYLPEGV